MTAVILAGGKGTRMAAYPGPKALLEVGREPFITRLIESVRRNGVDRVFTCIGRGGGAILDIVWQESNAYSLEWTPLGTGGAVKAVLASQPDVNSILVLNGDVIFDCGFKALEGRGSTMIVVRSPVGNADFHRDCVTHYQKEATDLPYSDCGGFYHRADFDDMPPTFDMEVVIKRLISRGGLGWHLIPGPVHHIGTPEGLEAARRYYGVHE